MKFSIGFNRQEKQIEFLFYRGNVRKPNSFLYYGFIGLHRFVLGKM